MCVYKYNNDKYSLLYDIVLDRIGLQYKNVKNNNNNNNHNRRANIDRTECCALVLVFFLLSFAFSPSYSFYFLPP